MGYNYNTGNLSGTGKFMADKRINEAKKKPEQPKVNLYTNEYNEKVEQLHKLIEWFEKEHVTDEILSKNITKLKDAALLIQPLPNKK